MTRQLNQLTHHNQAVHQIPATFSEETHVCNFKTLDTIFIMHVYLKMRSGKKLKLKKSLTITDPANHIVISHVSCKVDWQHCCSSILSLFSLHAQIYAINKQDKCLSSKNLSKASGILLSTGLKKMFWWPSLTIRSETF